jgi:hypothetical protein
MRGEAVNARIKSAILRRQIKYAVLKYVTRIPLESVVDAMRSVSREESDAKDVFSGTICLV